ncbi:hypothetical protein GCM10022205_23890 [Spinactinospora alkalitolerans]
MRVGDSLAWPKARGRKIALTREAHADTMGTDRHRGFGPAPKAAVCGRVLGPGFTPLWPVFHALGGRGRRARWSAPSPRTETPVASRHTRWRRGRRGAGAIP